MQLIAFGLLEDNGINKVRAFNCLFHIVCHMVFVGVNSLIKLPVLSSCCFAENMVDLDFTVSSHLISPLKQMSIGFVHSTLKFGFYSLVILQPEFCVLESIYPPILWK